MCNSVSGKLHGFVKCPIYTDLADDVDDDIFSADIFSRFSSQYKLNRRRNFKPDLTGCHTGCDIGRSHTG